MNMIRRNNLHLYQPRTYRDNLTNDGRSAFTITLGQSDLYIHADHDLSVEAYNKLRILRSEIEIYGDNDPLFFSSLIPVDVTGDAPQIIREMSGAAHSWNVGPMASVAGAISEGVARHLNAFSNDICVENGGDIYIFSDQRRLVGIYAGSNLSYRRYGLKLPPFPAGVSVCTSSGTVGHSLSFGNADAVTVVARSGSYADAAATALANCVGSESDIEKVLYRASQYDEIIGVAIMINGRIGLIGEGLTLSLL